MGWTLAVSDSETKGHREPCSENSCPQRAPTWLLEGVQGIAAKDTGHHVRSKSHEEQDFLELALH